MLDLGPIKAQLAAITEGEWWCEPRDIKFWRDARDPRNDDARPRHLNQETALADDPLEFLGANVRGPSTDHCRGDFCVRDAWFIAHAPENLRALVAEIENLRAYSEGLCAGSIYAQAADVGKGESTE